MTDEILSELDKGKKGSRSVTPLYNEIATMEAFSLTPRQWGALGRFDKLLLNYFRVMKQYYERKAYEESKKEMEREENRRKFMASLPKVRRR